MKVDGILATLDKVVQTCIGNNRYGTVLYVRDFSNVIQHGHYYTVTDTGIAGLDGCECYVGHHDAVCVMLIVVDPLPVLLEKKKVWYE